jgi:hypothetical protein
LHENGDHTGVDYFFDRRAAFCTCIRKEEEHEKEGEM